MLGEPFSLWLKPHEILPFKKFEAEKEQQASEMAHLQKLRHASQFAAGLKVATPLSFSCDYFSCNFELQKTRSLVAYA